jgi:hypothetical protein
MQNKYKIVYSVSVGFAVTLNIAGCFSPEKETKAINCIALDYLGNKEFAEKKVYVCSPAFYSSDQLSNGYFYFFDPIVIHTDSNNFSKFSALLQKASQKIDSSTDFRGVRIDLLNNKDTIFSYLYVGKNNVSFIIDELEKHHNEILPDSVIAAFGGSIQRYQQLTFR